MNSNPKIKIPDPPGPLLMPPPDYYPALLVQTNASGVVNLTITDTAKTVFNVIGGIGNGEILAMTLATASYG